MASRDGPVDNRISGPVENFKPGFVLMTVSVKVPAELKYLINYYKSTARLPSFNWAVRQLLETHPALARLAADLYTASNDTEGPGGLISETGESQGDGRPSTLARLFLGQLRSCQIPDSRRCHALC